MIKRIVKKPPSTQGIGQSLPLWYPIYATLAALLGYSLILCFPILFVVSAYQASLLLPYYPVADNLPEILWWISVCIFSAHAGFNVLSIDFLAAAGLQIQRASAGRLFQLLEEIKAHYPQPAIHRIIITENYELKLEKTPRSGLPGFARNVLTIGLPLMLTVSPNQMRCLLTRAVIQHSKQRGKIASWLHQLRDLWQRYCKVFDRCTCLGHQVLRRIFSLYCRFYDSLALPARIADELNADRNSLDLLNSDELLGAIQAKLIGKIYFEDHFYPEVHRTRAVNPFSRLQAVAKPALAQSNSNKWLHLQNIDPHRIEHYPTLQQRMENLGQSALNLPPDLTQSAAEFYFQQHLPAVIAAMDSHWQEQRARELSPRAAKRPREAAKYPAKSH